MSPLELIVKYLDNHWQCHGCLRMESNDCQICGYEYCAEGAIADIYLKHAQKDAEKCKAKWDYNTFVWEENGETKKEVLFMPLPVMRWIDAGHGDGTAEKLRISLAYLNDRGHRWSLGQIADLIKMQFGMEDVLATAKEKGTKAYEAVIKKAQEQKLTA